MTTLLEKLRNRIKDTNVDVSKRAFDDTELQDILDAAISEHTRGQRTESTMTDDDEPLSMMLAHCSCLEILATDYTKFFKWTDGNVSVDKNVTQKACIETAKIIHDRYDKNMMRKLRERENDLDEQSPAGRLLNWH